MLLRKAWFVGFVFLAVACGKNDVVPIGSYPYQPGYGPSQQPLQAPPPPGYTPQYPAGQYPPTVFRPQMPVGMPPQYYPFLPIDNYFRHIPQFQNYWPQFWNQWQQYAQNRGYNQYDFAGFWTDFCPQMWQGTQYSDIYNYFNQGFYYWVTPQTQFSYGVDPSQFWSSCDYYPYPDYYTFGNCDSLCY